MLSIMLPHRSPRYFLSALGTASRLLGFALGVTLMAAAAPAVAQGGPVPTATVVTPAPTATPPAAGPASGGVAPAPVAPPAIAPAPGTELPSLAPSPLLEPGSNAQPSSEPSETDARALTEFRPTLDAYGGWVEHPSYGLVWVPRRDVVGEGFAPYVTSGHWALDTAGDWVWVSDYPFGSIVFHYGRWAYVSDSGWVWVPGYRYAPAGASWRGANRLVRLRRLGAAAARLWLVRRSFRVLVVGLSNPLGFLSQRLRLPSACRLLRGARPGSGDASRCQL